jgi:hypothetical protein
MEKLNNLITYFGVLKFEWNFHSDEIPSEI